MRGIPLALLSLLVAPALLAGCLYDPYPAPKDVEVSGRPSGFMPTNTALKLMVSRGDGSSTTVAFDRTEWYVAALEREITHKSIRHVSLVGDGKPNSFEVAAKGFVDPEAFNERFRYEDLRRNHTPEELAAMDREYDRLLAERAQRTGVGAGGNSSLVGAAPALG